MMVLCEPKHVGAAFIILTILIIQGFLQFVCISWTIQRLILLMHGEIMKYKKWFTRHHWKALHAFVSSLKCECDPIPRHHGTSTI